ncbi:PREDICTED: uncharacterized protein LOC109481009 [Branchiostoma belcheri]|uniref:Uncharacterized protein LOC109481009 n=1 Tax=Branchiostoma belcheri TaxID=7741 RepID=A0A6P5A6Y1_BRABE|nr:PREDICTED: uncharacterized protein LOC109481009 [Branchiostoma belcheri]
MANLLHLLVLFSVLGCSFADHPGHVDYPGGLQSGCLQGGKHKDAPSPEEGLGVCRDYSDSSCCTADIPWQLSVTPIVEVDGFRWDNCGTLSKRCQDFMVNVECFYRCSPSLPTWAAAHPSAVRGVPVCGQFCDDWMDACRDDLTCADNWITGWRVQDGELNKCRKDERCRSFAEVFRNGRGLCESIWGQSFTYESTSDTPCLDFRFPPNEGQITVPEPGTESTEPAFKRQDECIIDAVDFHKKKPSPEPKLNVCRDYRQDSCCTTEIDNDMLTRPIGKVGPMNWDTCGPLSPRCEEFLIDSECFYQCSPLVNKWRVPGVDPTVDPFTPVVEGIPLCSHFCDGMFNACKFDRTCAVNWASDWDFSTGENKCKPDSKCEFIKDVFQNAKHMCESVWGSAFRYVSNRNEPCLDPSVHPNEQVTKPRKGSVAPAESEDKWGCLKTSYHKSAPSPEPGLHVCSAYSMNSCCTEEKDRQLRMSPVMKIDNFYLDRCGTLSPRCEQFRLALNCHYHCDPMIYRYTKQGHTRDVQHVPICSTFCDDYFDACRDDLTCAESMATDWYFTPEGINNCRPDSECRTFAEVYVDGRGLCNNLWSDSYVYSEDEDTCINLNSVGSQTRAGDAEENTPHTDHHADDGHRHGDMGQADSDSWACTRHDHRHHKEYPTPEPDLQVCSPYTYGSCCTAGLDRQLAVRPVPGVDTFSWNRCGTVSPQCENFLIDLECFNKCSPDIGRLSVPTDTGSTIPVCASFCDRWFDACRNDVTCVANWRSDWDMDDQNRNNCPAGSSCVTFDKMYGDARTLCETFFGSEFQYNSTDRCVDIPLHSSPVQDQDAEHSHESHHEERGHEALHSGHDHGDGDVHGREGHRSGETGHHSHELHHPGHDSSQHGQHGHETHHPAEAEGHGHGEHHRGHEGADHGEHGHEGHHSGEDGHGHEAHHPGHSPDTHGEHGDEEHHHGDAAAHGHEMHHGDHGPAAHGEHGHAAHHAHGHRSHHDDRNDVRAVQPLAWPVHQCVWQTGLKDHDGWVTTCSFKKRHYNSVLRLAYSGGLILANCTECCKRWYFTINGIECQKPGGIDAIVMKMGHEGNMLHQHQQFEGFCDKVGVGVLDVELRVQDCTEHMPHHGHSGATEPGDAQTGGHCFSRIIVEEVDMSP